MRVLALAGSTVMAGAYDHLVGKQAVWTAKLRRQTITFLVKIVDTREMFDRVDVMVESNTGDRVWVSTKVLEILDGTNPRKSRR